jgi:hypothetical protein
MSEQTVGEPGTDPLIRAAATGVDRAKLSARHRAELQSLRRQVSRFLEQNTEDPEVKVEVSVDEDGWFEFQGRVDQSGTKAALFGMVPAKKGAQRIVDRLHVGRLSRPH